jgi:phasin family protein
VAVKTISRAGFSRVVAIPLNSNEKSSRKFQEEKVMVKSTIPKHDAEEVRQMANVGSDWVRHVTEESLDQTASMLDRFISGVGRAADTFDRQASEVRDRSLLMAKETLANSMEFAHRAIHIRQPQELFQLQSEFISKQAQTLAEHSRHFGQSIAQGMHHIGRVTSEGLREASRTASEAA